MSQNVDQREPGSEDIFNTEELLQGRDEFPGEGGETAADEPHDGESMELDEKTDQTTDANEINATEGTNEDDQEVESTEITEGNGNLLIRYERTFKI